MCNEEIKSRCNACDEIATLTKRHHDELKPDVVQWLCYPCQDSWDSQYRPSRLLMAVEEQVTEADLDTINNFIAGDIKVTVPKMDWWNEFVAEYRRTPVYVSLSAVKGKTLIMSVVEQVDEESPSIPVYSRPRTAKEAYDLNYGDLVKDLIHDNSSLIEWMLMASYQYYIRNDGILSDVIFDSLCSETKRDWDSLVHPYKKLIDLDNLSTGSLFNLKEEDYPEIIKDRASMYTIH